VFEPVQEERRECKPSDTSPSAAGPGCFSLHFLSSSFQLVGRRSFPTKRCVCLTLKAKVCAQMFCWPKEGIWLM
jgi:hypothetical protein